MKRCLIFYLSFLSVTLLMTSLQATDTPNSDLNGNINFEQVRQLVRTRNPTLQAYQFEQESAQSYSKDAGRFYNPTLSLQTQNNLGLDERKGLKNLLTTLSVNQTFALGDKLQADRSRAVGNLQRTEAGFVIEETNILAEARIRFIHVVADQHRLALEKKNTELANKAFEAAEQRVKAGGGSALEAHRTKVMIARSRINAEHAEHELLASKRRLAELWGSTEAQFAEAHEPLFVRTVIPAYDVLLPRIEHSPELQWYSSESLVREAEYASAKAQGIPDLQAGLGVQRYEGEGSYGFMASIAMPVPIFQQNKGNIGAASARKQQLSVERERARIRLNTEFYGEYQELLHIETELSVLENEVLPHAQSMLQLASEGFRLGRFTQLDWIDAQRTLAEVQREYIVAAESFHVAVARLERLLGTSLQAERRP